MIIHKTENLFNLSAIKELPEEIIKGLFIRFKGVNFAGATLTEADLGNVRVNYRGSDIVNAPVSFFSLFNNLHRGVAEFSSAIGAAFVASIYVPFHVPWDDQNGLVNRQSDKGVVELRFPAMVATLIASGTVEIYYIPARSAATYIPLYLNQNIQVGGASTVIDRFQSFNISSLYIVENANISTILVFKDGKSIINANQAVLKAKSNFDNRVETATTLIQIDLNPNQILSNALSNNLEINVLSGAATAIETYYLAVLFNTQMKGAITQEVIARGFPTVAPVQSAQ